MVKKVIPAATLGLARNQVNPDALEVISRLQSNGYAAYIVGGGVRDLLLGRQPKDFDIVTDAVPEKIRRIFGRNSMIIGRRFKIVHVYFEHINAERSQKLGKPSYVRHILEVSTYRSNQVDEHILSEHGRILEDNHYGSMDEDAFRRDFTVNALYYDPLAEVVIDYHNGIGDIDSRLIRVIGNAYDRYLEDPVRVLRAIRLSEKLGLTIDEDTYINFRNAKHLLLNEPRGRLFEEMLKILLSGNAQSVIKELALLKLPRRVFPLFDKLFFSNSPHLVFAQAVLAKTDNRINGGEDVSLIYILAGLIWPYIAVTWNAMLEHGAHPRNALLEAIAKNTNFIFSCGITRNLYHSMREIWLLQFDFQEPSLERLDHFLGHSRFRQAWHLYGLRHEFQQVDDEMFKWWDNYINNEAANQTELLVDLAEIATPIKPKKKRKRKAKRRKPVGVRAQEMLEELQQEVIDA